MYIDTYIYMYMYIIYIYIYIPASKELVMEIFCKSILDDIGREDRREREGERRDEERDVRGREKLLS
jgi:hypothetical protein